MGYGARIAAVAGVAVVARTLGFAVQAAAGAHPALNALQYGVPVLVSLVCAWILLRTKVKVSGSPSKRTGAPAATPVALAI